MTDTEGYKTIASEAFAEILVKRSRFLGFGKPIKKASDAMFFLNLLKQEHRAARHHVYAYSLHLGGKTRYSDDAEPQGSAGLPILGVINSSELYDCVIVVVRYFGGVLLGKSGLTTAYRNCAKATVESATIISVYHSLKFKVNCNYKIYKKFQDFIIDLGGSIDNVVFLESVRLEFHVRKKFSDKIYEIFRSFGNNVSGLRVLDECFMG
ncbi:MAG: YigZ family protein [Oscillospiraceae bacterium]|jgi:uncharacterized YigZ family protein|nr:YigZ family protein [Oscillospiraceae bacterium]